MGEYEHKDGSTASTLAVVIVVGGILLLLLVGGGVLGFRYLTVNAMRNEVRAREMAQRAQAEAEMAMRAAEKARMQAAEQAAAAKEINPAGGATVALHDHGESSPNAVVVRLDAAGQLTIGAAPITLEALSSKLKEAAGEDAAAVVIMAHPECKMAAVQSVLRVAGEQALRLSLLVWSEPEEGTSAPKNEERIRCAQRGCDVRRLIASSNQHGI